MSTKSDIVAIRRTLDKETTMLLRVADSSSLVQAHEVSDPIFAPVRKFPPEMLAKIFKHQMCHGPFRKPILFTRF